MEEVQEFNFSERAAHFATSVATMTLYQVLLGRDPENSHVIEETKTQPIEALFKSFVRSAEFRDFVIAPLQRGARLRHELTSPAPNAVQLHWLVSLLVLPESQRDAIVGANSWPRFFRALLSLPEAEAVTALGATHPTELPGARPESIAGEPSLVSIALAEIAAIELRLDRLKTLLRDIGEQIPE